MADLRYPIGELTLEGEISEERRQECIEEIAAAPSQLRTAVEGLSGHHLDTPYRPGGWSVRQVVHHLPDSHLNSYVRFKLALTEPNPTIRPYDQDAWAALVDSQAPVELSLSLFETLHRRWVLLLRSLDESHFARTYYHPESRATVSLNNTVALYAWHGRHHIAHITALRRQMDW